MWTILWQGIKAVSIFTKSNITVLILVFTLFFSHSKIMDTCQCYICHCGVMHLPMCAVVRDQRFSSDPYPCNYFCVGNSKLFDHVFWKWGNSGIRTCTFWYQERYISMMAQMAILSIKVATLQSCLQRYRAQSSWHHTSLNNMLSLSSRLWNHIFICDLCLHCQASDDLT